MELEVNYKKNEENKIEMQITVPSVEVEKAINKKINELSRTANIHGFRKGKIPRIIIENSFGMEYIQGKVLQDMVPDAYLDSIKKVNLKPATQPDFDFGQIEINQPFVIKASFEVLPEVILNEYKGIKVKKKLEEVKEDDIEEGLKNLLVAHADYKDINTEADKGHFITFDFEIEYNGKRSEGKHEKIELGKELLLKNIETNLIGLKTGEERVFSIKYPDDYADKEFAGKDAKIKIIMKTVQERVLPEINQEFLKKLGNYNIVEELKADIEKKIKGNKDYFAEKKLVDEIIEVVCENSKVEVSKSIVEAELDNSMKSLEINLKKQGETLETYTSKLGIDMETLKKNSKIEIEKEIKFDLIADKISEIENINVSVDELKEGIGRYIIKHNLSEKSAKQILSNISVINKIKKDLLNKKVIKFLRNSAIVE